MKKNFYNNIIKNKNSISHSLLLYANQSVSIKDFLKKVLESLISISKSNRIEISLSEKGKKYYCYIKKVKTNQFFFTSGPEIKISSKSTGEKQTSGTIEACRQTCNNWETCGRYSSRIE